MRFYEVLVADSKYKSDLPLTYSAPEVLKAGIVITVELKKRPVTAFVLKEVPRPDFATKPIKKIFSSSILPLHCLILAEWISGYYLCPLGEVLRQFAPSKPTLRKSLQIEVLNSQLTDQLGLELPLTDEQQQALNKIKKSPSTTILLHGETGSGKTRVYLELAKQTLNHGKSVFLLTPEISLTAQLAHTAGQQLSSPIYVLHSRLGVAKRKQIWQKILEASEPLVVIGPRSALFSPVKDPGLIVIDEAHEPAYKQEQSPYYHAVRVASQLGVITGSKVILGTATPSVNDYYLASKHQAVVRMLKQAASGSLHEVETKVIDIKNRTNFTQNNYLSNYLIDAIRTTLSAKKQVIIYLNRRGTARLILCSNCSWQLLCPNCDIPLIYHADSHLVRCHICGHNEQPPLACPVCANPDVIYKSIGTKALVESIAKLFPEYRIQRFDSDSTHDEAAHIIYSQMLSGEVDIMVGTQLLAKGFDLPKLGLVGIVAAETSLALPDYTAEERTFQLLYQIIGRVGRGHVSGRVVVQSYNPDNPAVKAAIARNWDAFYSQVIKERQMFRFPPFSYLLKLTCRRATSPGAEKAALNLKSDLLSIGLAVEIIGPSASFYARRGKYYYFQLVVKSKDRNHLVKLAQKVPANWMIDLDPTDLL